MHQYFPSQREKRKKGEKWHNQNAHKRGAMGKRQQDQTKQQLETHFGMERGRN
jgi:hypothetical protein